jgi:hypothetical protein
VRVRNANTGQELILVAKNGEGKIPDNLLASNETLVRGYGPSKADGWHAEANISEWLRRKNNKRTGGDYDGDWAIKEGGASQIVCPNCQPLLDAQGLKVDGAGFWRE